MQTTVKPGDYILIKENAEFKIMDGLEQIGTIGIRKDVSYIVKEVKPEGHVVVSYRTYTLELPPKYWTFQAKGGDS